MLSALLVPLARARLRAINAARGDGSLLSALEARLRELDEATKSGASISSTSANNISVSFAVNRDSNPMLEMQVIAELIDLYHVVVSAGVTGDESIFHEMLIQLTGGQSFVFDHSNALR